MDYHPEDSIRSHITTPLHDQNFEKHIHAGAPYALTPGFEDRIQHRRQNLYLCVQLFSYFCL